MARYLKIESCFDCPSYDHSGGFTPGGSFPLCRRVDQPRDSRPMTYKGTSRVLPWEAAINERTGAPTRSHTGAIPVWCPLLTIEEVSCEG